VRSHRGRPRRPARVVATPDWGSAFNLVVEPSLGTTRSSPSSAPTRCLTVGERGGTGNGPPHRTISSRSQPGGETQRLSRLPASRRTEATERAAGKAQSSRFRRRTRSAHCVGPIDRIVMGSCRPIFAGVRFPTSEFWRARRVSGLRLSAAQVDIRPGRCPLGTRRPRSAARYRWLRRRGRQAFGSPGW
jgi:hypothetical protein